MTFLQLMQLLERRLGYHQLPVNADAVHVRDIFESCAVHHDLATRLLREIYRANRCQRTGDLVERDASIAAILPIRAEVLKAPHTDVDMFRFLETFCEAMDNLLQPALLEDKRTVTPPAPGGSNVIPFERFRQRLKMKSLG